MLILQLPLDDENLFAAAMFVMRKKAATTEADATRGAGDFRADAIEHEPIDPLMRRGHKIALARADKSLFGKIGAYLHGAFIEERWIDQENDRSPYSMQPLTADAALRDLFQTETVEHSHNE
jgi:hypothetical protein